MTVASPSLDHLIDTWETQQEAYIRHRAQRFGVILDALTYARPGLRTVLDLGAGLGSFSKLILQRFPEVRVHAVDYDPALLRLLRHNLAEYADRLTVTETDLRDPAWQDAVGAATFDAAVSSTALHWLPTGKLVHLYRSLAGTLAPHGVFFNADHLSHPVGSFFHQVATADDAANQDAAFGRDVQDWNGWWSRLRATDGFTDLVAERDRRFARDTPEDAAQNPHTTAVLHTEALRVAGFQETGTLWQYFDDYVVYAVR